MYKTLTVTQLAGQANSPAVAVPGRLIGYSFTADTGTTARIQLQGMDIYSSGSLLTTTLAVGSTYVAIPFELPTGSLAYRLVLGTVQTGAQPVTLYYEDGIR